VLLYLRTINKTINDLYGRQFSTGLGHLQVIPDVMRFLVSVSHLTTVGDSVSVMGCGAVRLMSY
jgi:hypothetical protein